MKSIRNKGSGNGTPMFPMENSVKLHIMPNFKIALHNLEQLNQKSGATQWK